MRDDGSRPQRPGLPSPTGAGRPDLPGEHILDARPLSSTHLLHAVLLALPDGVIVTTADGVVELANEAAERVLGVSGLAGRDIAAAVDGWSGFAWRVPVTDTVDPHSAPAEVFPRAVGGEVQWLRLSAIRLPGDATAWIVCDVTAQRELERSRGDVVATVSHELRTPLASVYGAALTLQRVDVSLAEDTREQLLGIITTEARRLGAIISDILTATRLDAGQVQFAHDEFDARAVVEEVAASAGASAGPRHHIELAGLATPGTHTNGELRMIGDTGRLQQVLGNLVENAVKYSPAGGSVELGLQLDEPHLVHFWVRDEGIGIEPADLSHVFDKFYRSEGGAGAASAIPGTGLGLYISRELVTRMGGTIRVESAVGDGTTFHVLLPAATDA